MKKSFLLFAALLVFASYAAATDCNFDSFSGSGTVPDGYCGITWGGVWTYYDGTQFPYTPFSPPERVYTPASGAGEYTFTLDSPAVFQGAYFSGYDFATVYFNLYDSSHTLLWTSASLSPTDVPTWLASGYSGAVSIVGVYSADNDFYVMDDVTYGTSVPEPGSIALFATGALGALGVIRRRLAK